MHICRPDMETPEVGDDIDANTPSTNILPVNGPGGVLSQRETEVLKLLADGESTLKIASIMDIKTSTVRIHIGQVLLKYRNSRLVNNGLLAVISTGRRNTLVKSLGWCFKV